MIKMGRVLFLFLLVVFCSCFWLSYGSSGTHSLRYFYTGVSDPSPGAPEFYVVGYVDEKVITWYDSLSQDFQPRAQWMAENEGPAYWEAETQKQKGWQQTFKASVKILMGRYNQSGVHTYQLMYGCEWNQDGSTWGFRQYAYDGHDFVSQDKDRPAWVPAMPGAEITTQRWNADRSAAERRKVYLEQTCIEWLKKYVEYGAKELNQKVQPKVRVWDRTSEGRPTTLHCLVTGFYPRDIEVKWMKNEKMTMQGAAAKDILPNHDGTYQMRESVDIDPQEEATYSCHVDHSSLPESLSVLWEPKSSSLIGIIIGVIAGVLLVIAVVVGVVIWKKRRGGYSQASVKEDGSSTSSARSPNPAI